MIKFMKLGNYLDYEMQGMKSHMYDDMSGWWNHEIANLFDEIMHVCKLNTCKFMKLRDLQIRKYSNYEIMRLCN